MPPGTPVMQTIDGTTSISRRVSCVAPSLEVTEGAGFKVRRPFPLPGRIQFDPFLMLDHLAPRLYAPGEFRGAPNHPHRGFETVSYILAGETEHKDSTGHSGRMSPGWVQWMTAGSGVIHDERPTKQFSESGGVVEGFQIWVNLPMEKKMTTPKYQDYAPDKIPKATLFFPGRTATAWANVIAGEANGVQSRISTESPIALIHYIVQPGGKVIWTVPESEQHRSNQWNVGCYVAAGKGKFGGGVVDDDSESDSAGTCADFGDFVIFESAGENSTASGDGVVVFSNTADAGGEDLSVILMAGLPLNEPIARHGPFVMNTRQEIRQAFQDYSEGKFGKIKALVVD
ncbi:hypothetical protein HDU82_000420 [Entophlyctis luteolus]|nr:hypothetical protein HDU82_000420 [Entophlyctis luteolus]